MLMVQANSQTQMKPSKVKGPPPVPPRPNQSLVAEALAKTRRAVAESKSNNNPKERQKLLTKSKTLDKTVNVSSAPPKPNGLARVKSFIKDVISDRSSSSDERKSSGTNSRRSSSDSSSVTPSSSIKRSNESLNSKVKSCKQILVRSLSTSNKLEQDTNKCKVTKSSSFAEKTVPTRKAPPPPLSPKPKIKRSLQPPQLVRKSSLDKKKPSPRVSTDLSTYSTPIDAKTPASTNDEPYATVEEINHFDENTIKSPPNEKSESSDERLQITNSTTENTLSSENSAFSENSIYANERLQAESPTIENNTLPDERLQNTSPNIENTISFEERLQRSPVVEQNNNCDTEKDTNTTERDINSNNSSLERKTSRVTELLISEILASRNNNIDITKNTVIDKGKDVANGINDLDDILPKDMNNHEMLIYELQTMRSQSNVLESFNNEDKIRTDSETSEQLDVVSSESSSIADDNEQAYAYILDDDLKSRLRKQFKAISTMSLHGLPPLPKSLSGFVDPLEPEVLEPAVEGTPPTDFDGQIAYLKKEMASLRQLDLSLLSELWSLSESMSAWRRQLERGTRRPAPPPPPAPHRT